MPRGLIPIKNEIGKWVNQLNDTDWSLLATIARERLVRLYSHNPAMQEDIRIKAKHWTDEVVITNLLLRNDDKVLLDMYLDTQRGKVDEVSPDRVLPVTG